MDPRQELERLSSALLVDYERSDDPVWRTALLRCLFHDVHLLLNQCLARGHEPPESLAELHDRLSELPPTLTADAKRVLPEVLTRPGREWEALIFSRALAAGWRHERSKLHFSDPSEIQAWIERSKRPEPRSVVLALERDPADPRSWWIHSVTHQG
jgi:hypothetical protein